MGSSAIFLETVFAVILIFATTIMALHFKKGYSTMRVDDDYGPTMSVHSSFLVISSNSTISLTCEGQQPIRWNTTINMDIDERAVIYQRPFTKRFKSTLTIESALYSDTGPFSCFYANDTNESHSATVYVYVTDSEHLLVPVGFYGEDLIIQAIQEGQEGLIPCKPTHPAANMTLIKFPDEQVLEHPGDVEFDPTRGFILKFPDIFYNGLFECKAGLGRTSQIMNFHLLWLSSNGKPPRPQFDVRETKINLDRRELNLTCVVHVDMEKPVEISWAFPNPKNSHIYIQHKEEQPVHSKNGYKFSVFRSNLFATHLDIADGGRYACLATNAANKTETAELYVPIESPARITVTNMEGSAVNVDLGDELKLRCEADGYPKPQLRWFKDGAALDPLRTRRYDIVDLQSKLIIEEVLLSDTGVYSCYA